MPVVNPEKLVSLQQKADDVRNICILAHVDHGKTSLTDGLIATNGIISPKMAGKIRYLDSRPDEQIRGITMESSAISLYFSMMRRDPSSPDAPPQQKEYLINLIDSPGHIDFSSEVSTASRLCDGAVVLVDAVEGVCSQTVTVLRQTWLEKLKPLLVINKMDRLVTELKMSPMEAYAYLTRLLEQVNAVIGSFFQGERMEEDLQWREKLEQRVNAQKEKMLNTTGDVVSMSEGGTEFEERDDEDLYFAPEKNNVIFASAINGWAFTVRQFAGIYEKKLGIKRAVLEKVLWGDFYLDPKTKKVLAPKHLKGRNLKPLFVQLVLESIWTVYEATTGGAKGRGDPGLLEKILKSLSITLQPHILRSRDPKTILTAVFAAWLPLSTATLVSVIECLPSPPAAQASRLPEMLENSPGAQHVSPSLKEAMIKFKTDKEEPVVAYVSKMVAVPESELPTGRKKGGKTLTAEEARDMARKKRAEIAKAQAEANGDSISGITAGLASSSLDEDDDLETNAAPEKEDPEHLIGFARLYSGTLSVGDAVYVLPPKFSPAHPHAQPEPKKVIITALYLLMGRSLEPLQYVPAGVVFGVAGLEGHILKTGTLCSQLEGGVNLAGVSMANQPIVRVALEPVNPADLDKMITGLKMLEQSDPCAQYEQLESGEHVILTAGELHLERCLKDLRERFAKCEIQAGEPIVPYRESIVSVPEMEPPKNKDLPRGTTIAVIASKQVSVKLRVRPLPPAVTGFLVKHAGAVKRLYSERQAQEEGKVTEMEAIGHQETVGDDDNMERDTLSIFEFRNQLKVAFDEAEDEKEVWKDAIQEVSAFGPRRVGPNLFLDATTVDTCKKFLQEHSENANGNTTDPSESVKSGHLTGRDFSDTISYAFQLATAQGPLCNEPMQGVAVFLEEVAISAPAEDEVSSAREQLGRLTGEVIKSVRAGIVQGFLDWSPRVLLAMYSCEVQASTEVLGRVYTVLNRRRGQIHAELLKEGTPFFTIEATLPVAESFGFSEEIRKRTSGAASPQLVFCGFEMIDQDPFWVPKTEEELEDLGELADRENVAKRYVDRVRRRKGLMVMGGKARDAEKQKTLKTN